ncbi:MAG: hypothetical protein ACRDTA_12120 [Pseudonocardiaceae bacterium]
MHVRDALRDLLPDRQQHQLNEADLVAAATEAWRRRHVNTEAGAAVIAALLNLGLSYRRIEELTGIPSSTANRWARPPDQDS